MEINHIASGSSGNAILVDDGESKLLLDAGIGYSEIAREVRPSQLAGVLITHEHKDHCKAVPELLRRGVQVWMSKGTSDQLIEDSAPYIPLILSGLKQVDIGTWTVLPFNVEHDVAEPLGFLIQSNVTGKKAVYIVDSGFVEYDFSGVSHWIIEANYSEQLLHESDDKEWLKDRIRRNHFSLDDLKRFFRDSDLSQTEEIHLVHLSNRNSHEELFKQEIQRQTGCPVYTISDSSRKDMKQEAS